jgi:hypothetical protein
MLCDNERLFRFAWMAAVFFGLLLLASCTPPSTCTVDFLITSINNANSTPATTDVIELAPGCTYLLDQVDNTFNGDNGLPPITSPIVIHGNDATIKRAANAPRFRLIYIDGGQGNLSLVHITLEGGYAYDSLNPNILQNNSGGAIFNNGVLKLEKSLIYDNWSREGAIFNANQMEIADSTITKNHDYFGLPGGAGLYNLGTGTIAGSTISYNGIPEFADGLFNMGDLEMTNCTVSGNGASGIDNEGNLSVNHITVTDNGGGSFGSAGILYVYNSLIESCTGQQVHTNTYNIDTDGTCLGFTYPLTAWHLAPLGNYGGQTETRALLPGSVAIDRVGRSCLPTDQRFVARPYGPQCDVGAYEYNGSPPPAPLMGLTETLTPTLTVTPTLTPTATITATLQPCAFTAAINLFCRTGPGSSLYPPLDSFVAGQSAQVLGQSADGQFAYVAAPNTQGLCVVPLSSRFGVLTGDCGGLVVFTPPPPPTPTDTPRPEKPTGSQPGCMVSPPNPSSAPKCVVPCPSDANPGTPCTP